MIWDYIRFVDGRAKMGQALLGTSAVRVANPRHENGTRSEQGLDRDKGRPDMMQVAVLGHSFGGTGAGRACLNDGQCKAGVKMDGQQQRPSKQVHPASLAPGSPGVRSLTPLNDIRDDIRRAVDTCQHGICLRIIGKLFIVTHKLQLTAKTIRDVGQVRKRG